MLRGLERLGGTFSIIFRLLVLILLASLASCVKPTVFPRYLTAADVINNVKCELYLAILETPNSQWLDRWEAAFTITLQVFRLGGGSGELSLVVPYDLGSTTIGLAGGLEKSSKTDISFDFKADTNLAIFLSKDQCAYYQELRARRNLAGETGLSVWFTEAIRSINKTNIENNATGITYNLEFITTVDGSIKPAFGTTYPSLKMFNGNFEFKRQRKDTNTLSIVFAKYKPPPIAFADTGLGRALDGIQQALEAAQAREDTAIRNLSAADARLREAEVVRDNARQGEALRQQLVSQRASQRSLLGKKSSGLSDDAIEDEVKTLAKRLPGADMRSSEAQRAVVEAQGMQEAAENQVRGTRREMRGVLSEAQREVARSRSAPVPSSQGSTQQTLNELQILNAIRNIPRR